MTPDVKELKQQLKDAEQEEKAAKKKKFKKLPTFNPKTWNAKKLKKPNTVAAIFLRKNGVAEPMVLESKKGFYEVEGTQYHERRDCTFTLKGNREPLVIIREGMLKPEGTTEWEDRTTEKKFAELQDHVLRAIRRAELVRMGDKDHKPLNMKAVVLWVIVGIIVFAIFTGFT